MKYKTTNRLFRGLYQYKIVLIVPGASIFRGGDMDSALSMLTTFDISRNITNRYSIKTDADLDYAIKLASVLKPLTDIDVRVESPWISLYSNSVKDIDAIARIDEDRVKYICKPTVSGLDASTVILPKMNYDYRITLGKTSQEHSAFIQWAENNEKLKLTKSCKRDLSKSRSWGGTHFYITGDNTLLMAKMHLGGSINKIERIIKA